MKSFTRYFKLVIGVIAIIFSLVLLFSALTRSDFFITEAMFFVPNIPYNFLSTNVLGCLISFLIGAALILSAVTISNFKAKLLNAILLCYFAVLSVLTILELHVFDWSWALGQVLATGKLIYFSDVWLPGVKLIVFLIMMVVLTIDIRSGGSKR